MSTEARRPPRTLAAFLDVFVDFAASGGERVWGVPKPYPRKRDATFLPAAARVVAFGDVHGGWCNGYGVLC